MAAYFLKHFPLHSRIFAEYADLFAMSLCLLITSMLIKIKFFNEKKNHLFSVLLVIGIKESAILNSVFTAVNLTVIAIVVIAGLTKIHGHNWNISPDEVNSVFRKFILKFCFSLH
jgi:hypothetical protein